MADTGLVFPTSASNSGATRPWVNPSNILTAGSPYAQAGPYDYYPQDGSAYLVALQPVWTLPASILVAGIEVVVNALGINSDLLSKIASAQLMLNGSVIGTSQPATTAFNNSAFVDRTLGGSANLWGTGGLTRAQLVDSTFGVRFLLYDSRDSDPEAGANQGSMIVNTVKFRATYSEVASSSKITNSRSSVRMGCGV